MNLFYSAIVVIYKVYKFDINADFSTFYVATFYCNLK